MNGKGRAVAIATILLLTGSGVSNREAGAQAPAPPRTGPGAAAQGPAQGKVPCFLTQAHYDELQRQIAAIQEEMAGIKLKLAAPPPPAAPLPAAGPPVAAASDADAEARRAMTAQLIALNARLGELKDELAKANVPKPTAPEETPTPLIIMIGAAGGAFVGDGDPREAVPLQAEASARYGETFFGQFGGRFGVYGTQTVAPIALGPNVAVGAQGESFAILAGLDLQIYQDLYSECPWLKTLTLPVGLEYHGEWYYLRVIIAETLATDAPMMKGMFAGVGLGYWYKPAPPVAPY